MPSPGLFSASRLRIWSRGISVATGKKIYTSGGLSTAENHQHQLLSHHIPTLHRTGNLHSSSFWLTKGVNARKIAGRGGGLLFWRISAIHAIHSLELATRASLGSLYFSFLFTLPPFIKALFVSFRVQSELTSSPTFFCKVQGRKEDRENLVEKGNSRAKKKAIKPHRKTIPHPPFVRNTSPSHFDTSLVAPFPSFSNPTATSPSLWNQFVLLSRLSRAHNKPFNMESSVFFKFKSQKEPTRVEFDGTGISVFELKREIILRSGLGGGTDFDLVICADEAMKERMSCPLPPAQQC